MSNPNLSSVTGVPPSSSSSSSSSSSAPPTSITSTAAGSNNSNSQAENSSSPSSSSPSSKNNNAILIHGEGSLDSASDLAIMVGNKNYEELSRRGGIEGILTTLDTTPLRGISRDSYAQRIQRWGLNSLPQIEPPTFWEFVKESLDDRTMKILIGAAVVSLVLGLTTPDPRSGSVDYAAGWMEGTAILMSVVIVSLVAAINNMQKERQFQSVSNQETVAPVVVVREGNVSEIPREEVVVGDIVSVHAGMSLPFDALLIEGTGYSANESSMSGEADDVPKTVSKEPFLISGTHIVDGCDGMAVVVAVGESSFAGSIEMSTRDQKQDTPLQEHLEEMADIIGRFGLAAAVLTFVVLLLKELFMAAFIHSDKFYFIRVFENLTTAVAIVVVAVPEGLPLSVTISLAYSMKRMMNDQNLVRHLAACETMGGATIICTDKTGTLTNNNMQVAALYTLGKHFPAVVHVTETSQQGTHRGDASIANLWHEQKQTRTVELEGSRELFLDDVVPNNNNNNNNSQQQQSSQSAAKITSSSFNIVMKKVSDCIALNYGTVSARTNRTAIALLELCTAVKSGNGYDAVGEADSVDRSAIQRFAFSSVRKRGSVVVASSSSSSSLHQQQNSNNNNSTSSSSSSSSNITFLSSLPGPSIPGSSGVVLTHYVAGAAELILQKCTSYVTPEGRRTALTADAIAELDGVIRSYSSRGWRTLCLGLSERRANWAEPPKIAPEDPLTFLAIVGLAEPLRPEVPAAIKMCRTAGVRTIMVTGDNAFTAAHIARGCTILVDDEESTTTTSHPKTPLQQEEEKLQKGSNNSSFSNGDFHGKSVKLPQLENVVIEGTVFREKSDQDVIQNVLPRIRVLARASPLDKKRLITLLKSSDPDAVVAVTGDGTNDAPALKAADVGFAMNSGSDIAKRSSDIVLLDDNFAGVVKAIVWGRNVRDNIKKFLQFQLTVNGVACLVAFLGALVNTQNLSPLKPVQLLWLNLIMDTFAALALATELPSDAELLARSPEPRTASMISPAMRTNIAAQGIFQLSVQLALLTVGEHLFKGMVEFTDVHITVVFNTFVMMQVFNFFNARKLTHDDATPTNSLIASPTSLPNHSTKTVYHSQDGTTTSNSSSSSSADNNNNKNDIVASFFNEIKSIQERSSVMVYIIITIFLSQILIVNYGGKFMSTVPLSLDQWFVCIAIASLSLPVGWWSRRMKGPSSVSSSSSSASGSFLAVWSTHLFSWMLSSLTRAENFITRLWKSSCGMTSVPKEKSNV